MMNRHRREQSDSHQGLIMRQSELQSAVENREDEIHITMDSPTDSPRTSNGVTGATQMSTFSPHSTTVAAETGNLPSNRSTDRRPYKNFRVELLKTFVALNFLMISAFLNFFLLTVIHDIVPMSSTKRLPDLVFSLIEQQRWAWAVGDVLSTVNAVVGFAIVLLHRERHIVLRRILTIGAIMYLLRAAVLSVTFLPPSFNNREEICQPQSNQTGGNRMYASEIATRFLTYVVTLGLTSGQEKILCGDLMFSGHTVVLTIMYFTQLQYTPRGLVLLRYISTPITFLGIAALVVSGGHYTMDVLVAYWLTSHVFWAYHQMFELPQNERAQAPMSRLWWYWICSWFESNVPHGRLKNEWDWPFPSPELMHKVMRQLNKHLQ
ncbi:Phosphatidylcholine:ceramide cholinephosphotransferase 2 [Aphelenchoides besseyi]|nr:Phosphatidylcholine:ceramide cholinephosphotransferase 2 [Aphelenchoides besseyi]